jgi:hypothetical protein
MSATLMNLEPKATQPRSSKYLASAMLFGSVYFLLSYLCPGGKRRLRAVVDSDVRVMRLR